MQTSALALDHVVILVADLEAAIADYARLGFTVQRGGTHADGATHNALVGFADGSYLELIAFLRPSPPHRWWVYAASGFEGCVDWALLPSRVGDVVDAVRARGVGYAGPIDGGRARPDGVVLKWQIATPPSKDLPFLCGDVTPREWRVREGDVRTHPNGVRGIAAVTVAVADLGASVTRYRALLGGDGGADAATRGANEAALRLGSTSIVLRTAASGSEADDAVPRLLATRGEGVAGLALACTSAQAPVRWPDERTHGAALTLQPAT